MLSGRANTRSATTSVSNAPSSVVSPSSVDAGSVAGNVCAVLVAIEGLSPCPPLYQQTPCHVWRRRDAALERRRVVNFATKLAELGKAFPSSCDDHEQRSETEHNQAASVGQCKHNRIIVHGAPRRFQPYAVRPVKKQRTKAPKQLFESIHRCRPGIDVQRENEDGQIARRNPARLEQWQIGHGIASPRRG